MQSSRVGTQVPRGTYSSPSYLLKSVHIDYLLHQVRLYVFPGLLPPRERVFALIPIKEKCQSCVGKRGGGFGEYHTILTSPRSVSLAPKLETCGARGRFGSRIATDMPLDRGRIHELS